MIDQYPNIINFTTSFSYGFFSNHSQMQALIHQGATINVEKFFESDNSKLNLKQLQFINCKCTSAESYGIVLTYDHQLKQEITIRSCSFIGTTDLIGTFAVIANTAKNSTVKLINCVFTNENIEAKSGPNFQSFNFTIQGYNVRNEPIPFDAPCLIPNSKFRIPHTYDEEFHEVTSKFTASNTFTPVPTQFRSEFKFNYDPANIPAGIIATIFFVFCLFYFFFIQFLRKNSTNKFDIVFAFKHDDLIWYSLFILLYSTFFSSNSFSSCSLSVA